MYWILAAALTLFSSLAAATPTCKDARYTALLPKGLAFGQTEAEVARVLPEGRVVRKDDVRFYDVTASTLPYSFIAVSYAQGKATRFLMVYGDTTMRKLGGPYGAAGVIADKLKARVGGADRVDDDRPGFEAYWNEHNGGTMQFTWDTKKIMLRIDCDALERHVAKQAADSVELGL